MAAAFFSALRLDDCFNWIIEHYVYRNPVHPDRRTITVPRFTGCRRFQILIYHKVSPQEHTCFGPLPPERFDSQMRLLKSSYQVFSLQELVDRSLKADVPERAVAVTFDDGYLDNFQYAFPILKKYELQATIFLVAKAVENGLILWHDRIFDAFRFATVRRCYLPCFFDFELNLKSPEEMRRSLAATLQQARYLPAARRMELVKALEQALLPSFEASNKTPMLTWREISIMNSSGLIHFGSHTLTHPILTRIEESELRMEIFESKSIIEDRLRIPISAFAYPNGKPQDFDEPVKRMVRKAGYQYAVTTCPGFNLPGQDLYSIKRGQPWQLDPDVFRLCFFLQRHGVIV
jgi:peptidoglycan/xylan/chitin deacetylase (PgdA/CDA1 family)